MLNFVFTHSLCHIWSNAISDSRIGSAPVASFHFGVEHRHDGIASACTIKWPADAAARGNGGTAECVGRQVALIVVSRRLVVRRTALRTAR